ncbi:hypothetical protein [Pseudooceanicola nanhaiensis]
MRPTPDEPRWATGDPLGQLREKPCIRYDVNNWGEWQADGWMKESRITVR